MARIRTIKPEFPLSESMGRVSREARLLFVQLWTICDDVGKTRAHSRVLASLLYPFDEDAPALIEDWISELEAQECVVRYVVDGTTYLQVLNWLNHQKIDRPSPSRLPDFSEESRILANPREPSMLDLGPRTLDLGPRTEDQGPEKNRSSASTERADSRFDDFWTEYPKKVEKKDAIEVWKRKKLDGKADQIIEHIRSRIRMDRAWRDGFIPSPKRFLRDERYLDEIEDSTNRHRDQVLQQLQSDSRVIEGGFRHG